MLCIVDTIVVMCVPRNSLGPTYCITVDVALRAAVEADLAAIETETDDRGQVANHELDYVANSVICYGSHCLLLDLRSRSAARSYSNRCAFGFANLKMLRNGSGLKLRSTVTCCEGQEEYLRPFRRG